MNVENTLTTLSTFSGAENIKNLNASGKVNLKENAGSKSEIDIGNSFFKELLFSSMDLKTKLVNIKESKTGDSEKDFEVMEEVLNQNGEKQECQDISAFGLNIMAGMHGSKLLDIKGKLENMTALTDKDLSKVQTKDLQSLQINAQENAKQNDTPNVQSNVKQNDTPNVQSNIQQNNLFAEQMKNPQNPENLENIQNLQNVQNTKQNDLPKVQLIDGKIANSNISSNPANQVKQAGKSVEAKAQNGNPFEAMGIIPSEVSGIEKAALRNGKEINLGKIEKLVALKAKKEEEPLTTETSENLSGAGKIGNAANSQVVSDKVVESAETTPACNQIADEIVLKLEQKGPMAFKLKLNPSELGEIDIKVKISEGKLSIDIISARAATQDILVSQVDKLITRLGIQNFQVENIQVNQNSSFLNQDNANQTFLMNAGMNFSGKRQQERFKDEGSSNNGSVGISATNINGNDSIKNSDILKLKSFDSHRINYAI